MRESQDNVSAFVTRYGLLHAPEVHALDLVAEVGEVAKAILKASRYGQRTPQISQDIHEELGDVCYALLALACAYGVDLQAALAQVLIKYEARVSAWGDPGSGR